MKIFRPLFGRKEDNNAEDIDIVQPLSRPVSAREPFRNNDLRNRNVGQNVIPNSSSNTEYRGPQIAATRGIRIDTRFNPDVGGQASKLPQMVKMTQSRVVLANQAIPLEQRQDNVFFGKNFDEDTASDEEASTERNKQKVGRSTVPDFITNAPVNNPLVADAVASRQTAAKSKPAPLPEKPKPRSPANVSSAVSIRPASAMISPTSGIANLFNNPKAFARPSVTVNAPQFPLVKLQHSISVSPESSPTNKSSPSPTSARKRAPAATTAKHEMESKLSSPSSPSKKKSMSVNYDDDEQKVKTAIIPPEPKPTAIKPSPVTTIAAVSTPSKNRIIIIGPSAQKSKKTAPMTKEAFNTASKPPSAHYMNDTTSSNHVVSSKTMNGRASDGNSLQLPTQVKSSNVMMARPKSARPSYDVNKSTSDHASSSSFKPANGTNINHHRNLTMTKPATNTTPHNSLSPPIATTLVDVTTTSPRGSSRLVPSMPSKTTPVFDEKQKSFEFDDDDDDDDDYLYDLVDVDSEPVDDDGVGESRPVTTSRMVSVDEFDLMKRKSNSSDDNGHVNDFRQIDQDRTAGYKRSMSGKISSSGAMTLSKSSKSATMPAKKPNVRLAVSQTSSQAKTMTKDDLKRRAREFAKSAKKR